MKEFTELRRMAREKCDKAINLIRQDYEETIGRIAALEQDLLGTQLSTHRFASVSVERAMPHDRAFTVLDVIAALEAAEPARVWKRHTILNQVHRFCKKGLVRRIRVHRNGQPTIYARIGVEAPPSPFHALTLRQAIDAVLGRGKPLRPVEVAVAILEAGYQTSMHSRAFKNSVGVALRGDTGRYACNAGKWSLRG